jgi:hypothetical protein
MSRPIELHLEELISIRVKVQPLGHEGTKRRNMKSKLLSKREESALANPTRLVQTFG